MRQPKIETFVSCLLGGAIGDALGNPIEFWKRPTIAARYGDAPPERLIEPYITDDTQMTLFTAEGLIRTEQRYRSKGIASVADVTRRAYLRWLWTQESMGETYTDPIFPGSEGWLVQEKRLHVQRAPGITCLTTLQRGGGFSLDRPPNDSKGCGAVMRMAPVGLVARDREAAFTLAQELGVLTHGHPSGYLSAAAFAAIIHDLVRGETLLNAVAHAVALLKPVHTADEMLLAIEKAIQAAAEGTPSWETIEGLGGGWVGEEALAIALLCALTADTSTPAGIAAALWRSVAHSGDSDSTGAITGNLLGAMVPIDRFPSIWLREVELSEVIERIARDLYASCIEGQTLDAASYPSN